MQRNNLALIGLVVFGVLALGLTLLMVLPRGGKKPAPAQGDATPAPVVKTVQYVAQENISPRTLITRTMVREEETDQAAGNGFSSFQDLQGRMVTQTVRPGEVITASMVTEPLARVTPANFPVPPGTRAVAVMVDPNQTVGGLVDAGDHVDVVVVHKLSYKTTQGLTGETRSGRTIAQNLLVLATDRSIQQAQSQPPAQAAAPGPNAGADAGAAKGAPQPPPPAPTPAPNAPPAKLRVVVAAPPAEAERIAAAQESGNIHLTLRDPSTPEEFPVPETFEYPVRFVPRPDYGGGQKSTSSSRVERSSSRSVEPIYPRPSMPGPSLQPMPLPSTPSMPSPAPSGNEVTVIRGTEKTRVLVPSG